jgi:hypothetical protein
LGYAVLRHKGVKASALLLLEQKGATMLNTRIALCIGFAAVLLPTTSRAFTEEDQHRLCTGDVFRLCASEIPNRDRITACMRRQRASLSEGCRSVFGKPAEQSVSAK